ncbi:MAG TPA: dienelactone hydrolase family protein [Methylomirabilota bacterium]|nr:dienelactone hydrolase family protein [Methylomirabilota bacterium]
MIVAGSTFVGYAMSVDKALAQAIKTDTEGLVAGDQTIQVGGVGVPAYEARPASGTGHPIILVISEVWGVHEYIKDCARRFAKAGYYAVAPELFVREGGVAQLPNMQDVLKIVFAQKREQTLGDLKAAVDWAKTRPGVKADRVGVTGWCWGGAVTYQVAATNPDVKAAVAWYGPVTRPFQSANGPVTGFDVAKDIHIPLLGLYGEKDTGPSPDDARKFIEMLRQHDKDVDIKIYPGAGHGFHADYRPSYNKEAAEDAWKRCTDWFAKYLKA